MAESVEIGQKRVLSEKRTLHFKFHGFEDLKHKRGECITSPTLQCHGRRWGVMLYPRGHRQSASDVVYVSAFLKCFFNGGSEKPETTTKYSIQAAQTKKSTKYILFGQDAEEPSWGWRDFVRRVDVLNEDKNYLVDGTLVIKVKLQVYYDETDSWTPTMTLKQRTLDMLKTGAFSDVEFQVGNEQFRAHKVFLATSAPTLLQLTEDSSEDTVVQIDGVDPSIFKKMLHFIYSEELPSNFGSDAKALLDVADKFGCTCLKLFAENELATRGISTENAAEMFLLADCKNCALLKEAATLFFVDNAEAVMQTRGFSQAKESNKILVELMGALANPPSFSDKMDETDIDRMGVSVLRRKLDEMGLDVDGTREMLVKRLQTNKSD